MSKKKSTQTTNTTWDPTSRRYWDRAAQDVLDFSSGTNLDDLYSDYTGNVAAGFSDFGRQAQDLIGGFGAYGERLGSFDVSGYDDALGALQSGFGDARSALDGLSFAENYDPAIYEQNPGAEAMLAKFDQGADQSRGNLKAVEASAGRTGIGNTRNALFASQLESDIALNRGLLQGEIYNQGVDTFFRDAALQQGNAGLLASMGAQEGDFIRGITADTADRERQSALDAAGISAQQIGMLTEQDAIERGILDRRYAREMQDHDMRNQLEIAFNRDHLNTLLQILGQVPVYYDGRTTTTTRDPIGQISGVLDAAAGFMPQRSA